MPYGSQQTILQIVFPIIADDRLVLVIAVMFMVIIWKITLKLREKVTGMRKKKWNQKS